MQHSLLRESYSLKEGTVRSTYFKNLISKKTTHPYACAGLIPEQREFFHYTRGLLRTDSKENHKHKGPDPHLNSGYFILLCQCKWALKGEYCSTVHQSSVRIRPTASDTALDLKLLRYLEFAPLDQNKNLMKL